MLDASGQKSYKTPMNPRLPNSKQWTQIPQEFLQNIRSTLKSLWGENHKDLEFLAEGRIYPGEMIVRIGVLPKGRLTQNNFEISKEIETKQPLMEQLTQCFDASMALAEEFISAGEAANPGLYPRTWKEFKFENKNMFFQYSTENSALESEANRLLGISEGLFNESPDEDNFDLDSMNFEDDGEENSHLH